MKTLDHFEPLAGLSDDQIKAFDKCLNWALNIREKQIKWFVIAGYAGTGKTYLIQRLIPALEQILGSNIGAAAPTNKAVTILNQVCGNLATISGTIHQFLGLRPSSPDENGKRQLEQGFTKIKIEKFSFVIIDEASMIGNELLKFIPRHIPIIFMGDIAQLPPIEDTEEISPILKNPDVILTNVIRYDGEVANHVFKIRQNLESKWLPRVQTSGNLTKWTNSEQWEQFAFESFRRADKPDEVKMLAWSNREVES
jgi:Cdc6-like AAA superfamily ATPase